MSRKSAFPYETEKRPFATNLRVLMKENGTTQRELGEAIGVRPQTIAYIVLGKACQMLKEWQKSVNTLRYRLIG